MSDVIPFRPREPHLSGAAECSCCRATWQAAAPVGVHTLECPNCGRMTGFFSHAVEPPAGSAMWRCDCGNALFWVTPDGVLCRKCGTTQRF